MTTSGLGQSHFDAFVGWVPYLGTIITNSLSFFNKKEGMCLRNPQQRCGPKCNFSVRESFRPKEKTGSKKPIECLEVGAPIKATL